MTIKLLANTVVGGSVWGAGDTLTGVDEREAKALINKGLAEEVKPPKEEDKTTEVNNG
jgi:hypothetical protein